jgi:UDP-N-acetylmuramate--alanine ligase
MEKSPRLPADLRNLNLYFVGIKGTGMSALAELCLRMGARVSGSDTRETFYTDAVLQELGIPYREGFDRENVPEGTDFLIYSAAYDPALHVELLEAARRSIPIMEYTRALGELSRGIYSVGIAGVHGKTTTTALLGSIVKELGLPGFVLVGSAVKGFQNRATYYGGRRFFIAETCEYRRHFLSFHPDQIVITTVDVDHLDYYRDYDDIEASGGGTVRVLRRRQGGPCTGSQSPSLQA